MKLFKINLLTIGLISFVFLSCKRDIPAVANVQQTDLLNSAYVQVFNGTVKSVRNYVYIDGVPVTGAPISFGNIFPANAFAAKVNAGTKSIIIKDTTAVTSQVQLGFTQNMLGGQSFTVFTYDTITSPKQSTVLNNIVIPTDTTCRLRFANFIYNTTAVPNVDVYSFRRITGVPLYLNGSTFPQVTPSALVFSNVATTQVTDFIPFAAAITDTLYVFATGTTTPIIAKQSITGQTTISALVPTRSYTSVYSGSFKGTKAVTTFATY